jgi:hypothetical protein
MVLIALACFLPGIDWGLPSRDSDAALFGQRTPWTGQELLQLLDDQSSHQSQIAAGGLALRDRKSQIQGADVDANPLSPTTQPIVVNATDAQRAEIVQRYRLMSGQPDEFIQFKALAEMAGRSGVEKLDPRLYQYGGLWIYPVGALLKVGDALGFVELRADRAFYLDHPEAFGRFYVVARLYSAMWGVVAVLAIVWLARRITASSAIAYLSGCLFAILPVVMNSAREAKPHLAGVAMVLLAVCFATKFVERRQLRFLVLASIAAGCAPAMVLSMVWSIAILPVMVLLSWHGPPARAEENHAMAFFFKSMCRAWRLCLHEPMPRLLISVTIAGLTYTLTNPFVIFNALFNRAAISSNLGNSTAMYGVGDLPRAVLDATIILSHGITPIVLIASALAATLLVFRKIKPRAVGCACAGSGVPLQLIALPTLLAGLTFVALAAHKPVEYARFGILLGAVGVLLIGAMIEQRRRPKFSNRDVMLAIALWSAIWIVVGSAILNEFRSQAATRAAQLREVNKPLAVFYPPAPWSLIPTNLFDKPITLYPRDRSIDFPDGSLPIYPTNLASQVGESRWQESMAWWRNRSGSVEAKPAAGER